MKLSKIIFSTIYIFSILLTLNQSAFAKKSQYSFDFGNDEFPVESDRCLTSVLKIVLSQDEVPVFFQNLTPFFADQITYKIQQDISTPDNIEHPDPNDRPYGGLLYLQINLTTKVNDFGIVQVIGGRVGILGKGSLAEQTQKGFHIITGGDTPVGWNNQLNTELGADFIYTAIKSFRKDFDKYSIEFLPYIGASAGTFFTHAEVGGLLRGGYNIPSDHGIGLIGNGYYDIKEDNNNFSAYLYAGTRNRAVLRNVFLDGNLGDDSLAVDKKDYVTELTTGVTMRYKNFETTLGYTYSTPESLKQDGPQHSLSISFKVMF